MLLTGVAIVVATAVGIVGVSAVVTVEDGADVEDDLSTSHDLTTKNKATNIRFVTIWCSVPQTYLYTSRCSYLQANKKKKEYLDYPHNFTHLHISCQ